MEDHHDSEPLLPLWGKMCDSLGVPGEESGGQMEQAERNPLLDARRYEVLEELQRAANDIRQLTERVDEARQRQRDLVVEAVDELEIRLPMLAQVAGLSPQRIHSLRAEELERRQRIERALRRYVTAYARQRRASISDEELERYVQEDLRGVPLSRIESSVRQSIMTFNARSVERLEEGSGVDHAPNDAAYVEQREKANRPVPRQRRSSAAPDERSSSRRPADDES